MQRMPDRVRCNEGFANFSELFSLKTDPRHVVIEFRDSLVVDHSAIEAIDVLISRYQQEGKTLHQCSNLCPTSHHINF